MTEDDWDRVCILEFCCYFIMYSWFVQDVLTWLTQCWSANVKVPRALLLAAKPTFDANPDGGQMLTTGSIAVRTPSLS
jgi:hypothetical protein